MLEDVARPSFDVRIRNRVGVRIAVKERIRSFEQSSGERVGRTTPWVSPVYRFGSAPVVVRVPRVGREHEQDRRCRSAGGRAYDEAGVADDRARRRRRPSSNSTWYQPGVQSCRPRRSRPWSASRRRCRTRRSGIGCGSTRTSSAVHTSLVFTTDPADHDAHVQVRRHPVRRRRESRGGSPRGAGRPVHPARTSGDRCIPRRTGGPGRPPRAGSGGGATRRLGVQGATGSAERAEPTWFEHGSSSQAASFRPPTRTTGSRKEVAMATIPLPNDPDIAQLKRRARRTATRGRAGDADALALVAEHHPRRSDPETGNVRAHECAVGGGPSAPVPELGSAQASPRRGGAASPARPTPSTCKTIERTSSCGWRA